MNDRLYEATALFVFVHRKGIEKFLTDKNQLKLARNQMYKYSKKSEDEFLADPYFACLISLFAKNPSCKDFIQKKFNEPNSPDIRFKGLMLEHFDEIGDRAFDKAKDSFPQLEEQIKQLNMGSTENFELCPQEQMASPVQVRQMTR